MSSTKLCTRISIACSLVAALGLAGCGGGDKGANTGTKVVIKPSKGGDATNGGDGESPAPGKVAEGFGTLKGRVVFKGAPPQLALLVKNGASIKDAEVCAAADLPDDKLVLSSDGGVANVFVYLSQSPAGAPATPAPSETVLFDQKGCRFVPHGLTIRVGQPLQIVSGDPIAHNTHVNSNKATPFNKVIKPSSRTGETYSFDKSENEPVRVTCDFHGWMFAWMLPTDHPFAAVTDANGEFEIKNVPAGTHRFKVWHEGAKYLERSLSVSINPDQVTTVEIPYPVEKFKP